MAVEVAAVDNAIVNGVLWHEALTRWPVYCLCGIVNQTEDMAYGGMRGNGLNI